jgi:hypothetical protein
MIPSFLRPERVPFASVEILRARLTDSEPVPVAPLRVICAWHPGFDRTDPANAGASHGICPSCLSRMEAEMTR